MDLIRKDITQKSKQLKFSEKINEKKTEVIEQNESEINQLKDELRNKSIEIKNLKNNFERNNFSTNITHNKPKPNTTFEEIGKKLSSNKKLYSLEVTALNHQNIQNNNPTNEQANSDFLNFAKGIFKQIEDEYVKKNKIKKKIKLMKKEKNDFLSILKKHEERLKTKIDSLAKAKLSFEQILKSIDDDSK